jgi:two-component system sensor histidine kinase UhpB
MMLLANYAVSVYLSVQLNDGRALRPVSRRLGGLQQIQAGDYDTQLKIPGLPELDRIIEGINHVSKTLKETRDENRALTRHSLLIQEEERRILAKEMHDEVGQNLTAIKMMSALVPEGGPNREHAALEIQRLCDRLFSVVRSIIHRLRPMILEDLGLKAALDDLAEHWRSMAPDLQISIRCDASIEHLSGETALEIYRIVQEAMTNIVRHSGATKSEISIFPRDPHELLLIVRDNGRGLSSAVIRRGFGLLGMRERVASLDGRFQLMSEPGQGLEIRISLPIEDIQNG